MDADGERSRRAYETFASRQRAMYTGGPPEPVRELLAADVVWHVPGTSAIAGDHRGRDAVMRYFEHRRELAGGRMTIVEHAQMANDDTVVRLADGEVELDGERLRWRTAGVYRMTGANIAEAWLVPLDLAAFEEIWQRLERRSQRELGDDRGVV
jgi:ketosteroid isomerase-like protein